MSKVGVVVPLRKETVEELISKVTAELEETVGMLREGKEALERIDANNVFMPTEESFHRTRELYPEAFAGNGYEELCQQLKEHRASWGRAWQNGCDAFWAEVENMREGMKVLEEDKVRLEERLVQLKQRKERMMENE